MESGPIRLLFASPRHLPAAKKVEGRTVVLDIAFAANTGGGVSFNSVTRPFITGLGDRLAMWIDHHDHELHDHYKLDDRFYLATKAEHGACPEMITPEMVERAGRIDTIVTHIDLDGLYSAAKWLLRGEEPYEGADEDARCVDTRQGKPSGVADFIDAAIRGSYRDDKLRRAVVSWLHHGLPENSQDHKIIQRAYNDFEPLLLGARDLAGSYQVDRVVAYVDARTAAPFDKTELLLLGQEKAPVSIVHDNGMITIAARFDSGWNFLKILNLDGGMPTRVSVPEKRLNDAIERIQAAG